MIWMLNRYSFLISSALGMGIAWLVGSRFGGRWATLAVAGTGLGLALVQRKLRGVGEPPTISSTPAVVAAIRAATGLALSRVPVRPEHLTGT